jgi:uncharacterized protein (DUF305 family)
VATLRLTARRVQSVRLLRSQPQLMILQTRPAAFGVALLTTLSTACAASPPPAVALPQAPATAALVSAADVRFMQTMIVHHAQALTMSGLAPERTERNDLRLLAERIAVSQQDEIALMRDWLVAAGESVPDLEHAHHRASHDRAAMVGMASDTELAQLAAARGPAFDRLFLELMIRHHEGALAMVAELFDTPGAAERSDVYRVAAEIDADQRAEIARMRALLRAMEPRQ